MENDATMLGMMDLANRISEVMDGENAVLCTGALGQVLADALQDAFPDPVYREGAFRDLVECIRMAMNEEGSLR